ncbi:MAG: 30S ribosomal protein S7 [Dehalococcoidia bacterium]|nr:30S ribosomal protein S7 [Dehalococcoidia bacterium]
MPRRSRPEGRVIAPDPKYNSVALARFINKVMQRGKKSVAQKIVYQALEEAERQERRPGLDIFEQAMRNCTPLLEVKPRRVGGATYQVPVEIRSERRNTLAMRWLLQSARAHKGQPMHRRLAAELVDAFKGAGVTVKKKEDTHRMAEANKAFAHYRW